MANRRIEEETAEHSSDAADISTLSKATLSPSENGQENTTLPANKDDRSQVDPPGEDEQAGKQEPAEETATSAEGSAEDEMDSSSEDPVTEGEDSADEEFQVPEILPLAGGKEAAAEIDPEVESEGDKRVWGNQVGGHVDRDELADSESGTAFNVDQIALKKTGQTKKTHSRSRTAISWTLGIVVIVAAIGIALYASGVWQKIFTPTGASSPQEGAKAYYGALLDKDAQTICALSSEEARGQLVQAISQTTDENSLDQCTQAVEKTFAQSEQSPSVKLADLRFSPETKADVDGAKAVLIKDKQGTPLQIMAWQEADGRWFLAGQNLQQKVMMKYQQSLVAGAEDGK
ncbi:MAG: hypothetical protein ACLR2M_10810 [Varibaculum sp.]